MSVDADPKQNSISMPPLAGWRVSGLMTWGAILVLAICAVSYATTFGAGYALGTRVFTAALLVAIFVAFRPGTFETLQPRFDRPISRAMVACLAGGALISFLVFALALQGALPRSLPVFSFWSAGAGLSLAALALSLAPAGNWRATAVQSGWALLPGAVIGFFLLDAIDVIRPLADWYVFEAIIDWLTGVTLVASASLMSGLGFDVYAIPATREFGMDDFYVYVWGPCSGIEGFVLISVFLSLYMWMFRKDLDFPRAFLLFPIGIALSWCLNVVRISALLFIGARISPELAVDSFHSHAGWLMFTVLAVTLTAATSAFGWFHLRRAEATPPASANLSNPTPPLPFLRDPNIVQILPFIVFMASAFLLETFTQSATPYYPLRAAAMLAVLALIAGYLRALEWSFDLVPVGAGALIGIAWLVTSPDKPDASAEMVGLFASMSGAAVIIWIIARTIGTVLFVPIIEELFFRGYVLRKLDTGSVFMRILAVLVSSAAFALLHQRWLAAFLAGLIFAAITLRRNRVSDAMTCHAVANGLIAAWAIAIQDWTVI